MNIKKLIDIKKLQTSSFYTITGVGGDLEEWVNGYNDLLNKEKIGTPKQWYTFKGRDVNNTFNLEGNNKFKDDLTFLAFVLNGLNVGKLAMFKLKMNDRWSDDIINNSISVDESIKIKRSQLKKIIQEQIQNLKPKTARQVLDELESKGISADSFSKKGDLYTYRKGFFYTHGNSAKIIAEKIKKAIPQVQIVSYRDNWKPFRGGAPLSQQSFFEVVFKY